MNTFKLGVILSVAFLIMGGCGQKMPVITSDQEIKAYNLDFNWGDGGPNAFAAPGLWADASPVEHVKWYKDLGVNTIQTFIVSCNGYAWYKNGVVPEQPGLKYDFLPEMVKLGHNEGMKVMGYLCIGSNTRWGMENPDRITVTDTRQTGIFLLPKNTSVTWIWLFAMLWRKPESTDL